MLKICRNIVKVEALKQLRAEGSWTLASPVRVSELLAGDYGHVTSANKLECPVLKTRYCVFHIRDTGR